MEDHNQSRNQTKSAKEKIIDLSADMALSDQTKHKIIDLTNDIDAPEDQPQTPPVEKPSLQKNAESTTPSDSIDDKKTDEPIALDKGSTPTDAEQEASAPDSHTETKEALFDTVSLEKPQPPDAKTNDLLFDELSDITQKVDSTVDRPEETEPADENTNLHPPLTDEAAAELEAAMEEEVDPSNEIKLDETELDDAIEEEGVIELVDVVDPSKLDASDTGVTELDEIIELTNVVKPEEIENLNKDHQAEGSSSEKTSPQKALDDLDLEEDLSLSDTNVSFAEDDTDFQNGLEGPFDDHQSQEDQEQVLQLTDVISTAETQSESTEKTGPKETSEDLDPEEDLSLADDTNVSFSEDDTNFQKELEGPFDDHQSQEDQEQVLQLTDVISTAKAQSESTEKIDIHTKTNNIAQNVPLNDDEDKKKIEEAVLHVIQTNYANKIETLIAKEVEKAVTREIENIKRMLSDDEPSI